MEYFLGSVKLMLFVYALAAMISLIMAWVIRLVFVGIRTQKNRAEAKNESKREMLREPADDAPTKTA